MAQRRALTAAQVTALSDDGVHWVAPSLYLQIRPQGTRSWLFRCSRNGENLWKGIGAAADKPLSEARDEAATLRVAMRRGEDPFAEREAAKAATKPKNKVPSFADCAGRYIESHRAGWRNDKHVAQWESTIRNYANPVLGKLAVDKVTVEQVLKVLKPIWTEKPETASRLRGRIEMVLGWATAMKYRSGDNPAAWKGALSHLLPPIGKVQTIAHRKAVPYAEVPQVVQALRKLSGSSARALIFTILTGARTGEVIGATWDEIDLDQKLWTIPGERMKAGKLHRVALSDEAVTLLQSLDTSTSYLFPGNKPHRPMSNMSMLKCLRGIRGDTGETVHGFRSSFRDWAAEKTSYPREIVEACLAHEIGGAVELAYRRTDFLDKRRELMGEWGRWCAGQ